jgi:hypothetical protein
LFSSKIKKKVQIEVMEKIPINTARQNIFNVTTQFVCNVNEKYRCSLPMTGTILEPSMSEHFFNTGVMVFKNHNTGIPVLIPVLQNIRKIKKNYRNQRNN